MPAPNKLKISHDINEFGESMEGRTLVMKDRSVLEEEESDLDAVEVEDLDLAEKEKEDRKKRQASHGKQYDPLDMDQTGPPTGILSKYDDFESLEKERIKSKQIDLNEGLSRISSSRRMIGHRDDEDYDDAVELPSAIRISSSSSNRVLTGPSDERLKFQTDFYDSTSAWDASTGFKKVKKEKKKRRITKSDDEEDKVKFEGGVVEPLHSAVQDDELYAQLARLRMKKTIASKQQGSLGADYIANSIQRDVMMEKPPAASSASLIDFVSRIEVPVEDEETGIDGVQAEHRVEVEKFDTVMEEEHHEHSEPKAHLQRDSALVEEVVQDSGLAGALKFFHSRGFIDHDEHVNPDADGDDIHLERRDEFGRSITDPKEAFKQLSWRFHGKKPGAKKQEKRLRKLENEVKSLKQ